MSFQTLPGGPLIPVFPSTPVFRLPSLPHATYWEVDARMHPEAEEVWGIFCMGRGGDGCHTVAESPQEVTVRFYFSHPLDPEQADDWGRTFAREYPHLPAPRSVSVREKPVRDWQENWREHFAPIPVGRGLMVCPPWRVPEGEELGGRLPLLIDPGQGFGTGGHASTVLALEMLERVLEKRPAPPAMLDVGIGSGILTIGARLMGVGRAVGLDIDPRVMPDVLRNAVLNRLAPPPDLVVGGPGALDGSFPLVVANITAPVLLGHSQRLWCLTAPAGCLILSGILRAEWPEVLAAFGEYGLELSDSRERDEWVAAFFRRPASH